MKIKDVKDAERYLENDCYCKYEIYDASGFFYRLFKPEEECVVIIEQKEVKNGLMTIIVSSEQLIIFAYKNDKIVFSERYDATDNNISQIKAYFNGEIESIILDEFVEGATNKALKEILDIADAVMIS